MYLKRIETIGFKSFADKTVVELNKELPLLSDRMDQGKVTSQMRFVGYLVSSQQKVYVEERWKILSLPEHRRVNH